VRKVIIRSPCIDVEKLKEAYFSLSGAGIKLMFGFIGDIYPIDWLTAINML
jgi:hypothetical protein